MRRRSLRVLSVLLLVLLTGMFALRSPHPTHAAGPFAYVSASNSQVYVIDTSTNTIVKVINTGQGAVFQQGVAVAPGGQRIYVTGFNASSTVAVIDGTTNAVITLIPVGSFPAGVAVSPDGTRVYVANGAGGSISVIDAGTNTVIQTIPVAAGAQPVGVVVSPDNTRLYVSERTGISSGLLEAYSTATYTLIGSAPLPGPASQVVVSPDGTRAYVADDNANVSVISVSGLPTKILDIVTPSVVAGALALTPDGTRLYASDFGDATVYAISTATNAVVAAIPVGNQPSGLSATPDGTRIYVANFTDGTVSVISVASNTVLGTINGATGAFAFGQFIQPNSATVTLTASPNPVFAGVPLTLTATVSCPFGTPTGTVTFTANGQPLATVPLANGTATATVPTPGSFTGFAVLASYSGNGTCLAAVSAPLTVRAQAAGPAVYLLTIPVTGCGSTTPSNYPVLALQNVSVTAVPCAGSVFVGWTGGPCDKTTINPCSIPAGTPVTANFAP
jgi:YVTN family beta-propeller protein